MNKIGENIFHFNHIYYLAGLYSFTIYAKDVYENNIVSDTLEFTIQNKAPNIAMIYPSDMSTDVSRPPNELNTTIKEQNGEDTGSAYGDFTYQGAYVYNLNLEDGFKEIGRITHMDDDDEILKAGYYPDYSTSITRTLYIDDYLYTISQSMVKINSLDDLNKLNALELQ